MTKAEQRLTAQAEGCEQVEKMLLAHFSNHKWTPWLYNQAVGWLRVYAYPRGDYSSAIISGEYYAVDAKRLSASLKSKRFLWAAEAFAVVIENETNPELFHRITDEIRCWAESELIRDLTLDLTTWNNIGPFVNWDRLVNCVVD